jgi:hypothetical protein
MVSEATIIAQTKKWITEVVVGCNFCPFAAKEVKRGSVHYEVVLPADKKIVLEKLADAFLLLDAATSIETILLIIPGSFRTFTAYLELVELGDAFLAKQGYEGVYQLASFHPEYVFAGTSIKDPSNFTNRSPYPMLHILRETSVTRAVDHYPDTANIPARNIAFTKNKGLAYMQLLRESCMLSPDS